MLVKNLIKKLQCFDPEHGVILKTSAECDYVKVECEIRDVKYEGGYCVIKGEEQ